MARAEFIEKLIKAHVENDSNKFRQIVMQMAAREASMGHNKIAKKMREYIDNTPPSFGQHIGNEPPMININTSKNNPNMKKLLKSSYPKENLNDMVLDEGTKEKIVGVINEWRHAELLNSHGLRCKTRLLLTGPPGCGKTMSSKVIASELGLPLYIVKLEGLISRYLGETSVHLKNIFDAIDNNSGVYLFDEFDSIGTTRGGENDIGEVRRVLSTFLIYMEEMKDNSILIAATNYKKNLDNALFRRFDEIITFPKPDYKKAKELFKLKLRNYKKNDYDLNSIVKKTEGMSYAEITKAIIDAVKASIIENNNLTEKVLVKSLENRKEMNNIHDHE